MISIRAGRATLITSALSLTVLSFTHLTRADEPAAPQYESEGIQVPAARENEPTIELSVERAAEHLEQGAVAWGRQRKCVSCHTNGSYLLIRPALSQSLGKPDGEVRQFFVDQLKSLEEQGARKIRRSGTRPAQVIYIAAGLGEWDRHVTGKLSPETDRALRLAFELQNAEGTWHSLTCWPPFESSAYQEAHMAAMAIATAPGWLKSIEDDAEMKAHVDRLTSYLRDTAPPHDYARVLLLWTSLRMPGLMTAEQQQQALKLLRSRQQADGGWSIRRFATPEQWGEGNRAEKIRGEPDFEAPPSDGHMTGLAVLILQEAGVKNETPELQRGLEWLSSNQRESGRWWTRSLNTDKWHFITYSGTAYALLALQNGDRLPKSD